MSPARLIRKCGRKLLVSRRRLSSRSRVSLIILVQSEARCVASLVCHPFAFTHAAAAADMKITINERSGAKLNSKSKLNAVAIARCSL